MIPNDELFKKADALYKELGGIGSTKARVLGQLLLLAKRQEDEIADLKASMFTVDQVTLALGMQLRLREMAKEVNR